MRKDLLRGAAAVLVFTVLLGLAYPLAVTGVGQLVWPTKANGDPTLIGKAYTVGPEDDPRPDPRYFQPRPSATDYAADATFFSNRGPNQSSAPFFYRAQLDGYLELNERYSPGLAAAGVPQDAVTTSASGVDPHISQANAEIQARRVAAVRDLPAARLDRLIDDATDGRALGVFGEPGVNVIKLNSALDEVSPR